MVQKIPDEINDKENSVNRETKPSDPEYFTISFYTHDNHRTGVLYDILSALNIHDIELFYDDHGTLIAVDDDNRWVGAEFYTFLMEDAFVYEENGSVLGIRAELYADFKALAKENGALPDTPDMSEKKPSVLEKLKTPTEQPLVPKVPLKKTEIER